MLFRSEAADVHRDIRATQVEIKERLARLEGQPHGVDAVARTVRRIGWRDVAVVLVLLAGGVLGLYGAGCAVDASPTLRAVVSEVFHVSTGGGGGATTPTTETR